MRLLRAFAISHRVSRWLAVFIGGGASMLAMVLVVSDATRRTVFAQPILGMTDVVRIILAWIAFAGFAYALVTGVHVRVTLFVSRLPARARLACEILTEIVGVAVFTLFTIILWPYFWESWLVKEIPMGPVPTPIWVAKLALPVGSTFIMIEFWLRLIQKLSDLKIAAAKNK